MNVCVQDTNYQADCVIMLLRGQFVILNEYGTCKPVTNVSDIEKLANVVGANLNKGVNDDE